MYVMCESFNCNLFVSTPFEPRIAPNVLSSQEVPDARLMLGYGILHDGTINNFTPDPSTPRNPLMTPVHHTG